MPAVPTDKYYLKSVHEEIDLFDRKLAHLLKFEKFNSEEERDLAARKLTVKRNTLVQTALRLAAEGVEFKQNELPRSLRPKEEPGIAAAPTEVFAGDNGGAAEVPAVVAESRRTSQQRTPYSGTALDWQASIRQYVQKRNKA